MTAEQISRWNDELRDRSPLEITRWAVAHAPGRAVVSTNFRPYEAVMLHLATQVLPRIPVLWVDHGTNLPETYKFPRCTTREQVIQDVLLDRPAAHLSVWLQLGVPLLVEAVLVLGWGRTVGELTVSLHTTPRSWLRRAVKLVSGVGLLLLGALSPWLLAPVVVLTAVAAVPTRGHRGLSHTLAGLDLRIGDDELEPVTSAS